MMHRITHLACNSQGTETNADERVGNHGEALCAAKCARAHVPFTPQPTGGIGASTIRQLANQSHVHHAGKFVCHYRVSQISRVYRRQICNSFTCQTELTVLAHVQELRCSSVCRTNTCIPHFADDIIITFVRHDNSATTHTPLRIW
jgi:hypothetical protein